MKTRRGTSMILSHRGLTVFTSCAFLASTCAVIASCCAARAALAAQAAEDGGYAVYLRCFDAVTQLDRELKGCADTLTPRGAEIQRLAGQLDSILSLPASQNL